MEKVSIPIPSGTSGLPPGISPYANPTFANAYKGAVRGLFGGVLLGGGIGATVGLIVSGIIGLALLALPVAGGAGLAMSWGATAGITGAFTLVGMKYYKDLFEMTGAVSGGVSAAFEKHDYREHQQFLALHKEMEDLRNRNSTLEREQSLMIRGLSRLGVISPKELEALQVMRSHDVAAQAHGAGGCAEHGPGCAGHAHDPVSHVVTGNDLVQHPITNYRELPKEANPSKPFVFWDVVGIGALVGAFIGAAFFGAGHLVANEFIAEGAAAAGHAAGGFMGINVSASTAAVATVLGGAIGGATYGVNRHYVRQWFHLTNALYEGDLRLISQQKGQEISNILENCQDRGAGDCLVQANEDLAPVWRRPESVPGTQVAQAHAEGALRTAPQPSLQASV